MKKGLLAVAMVVVLGMVANVALTETVFFPYWQHGWSCQTFFSVGNAGDVPVVVTINLLDAAGDLVQSTTGTVEPGGAWFPDTEQAWYTSGDQNGFGTFVTDFGTETPADVVYLWGCIYANLTGIGMGQPGFTLVLPQNPYGAQM